MTAKKEAPRSALEAMLRAKSIAVVGASNRGESFGNNVITHLTSTGYTGQIYPVNPRYEQIEGLRCYPSVSSIPGRVDCAVLAVADGRLEEALETAATAQAHSAVIFGTAVEETQPDRPNLTDRLSAIARNAGMAMCGGNCMGFLNFVDSIMVGGWPYKFPPPLGNIGLITQSGSSYSGFALNQRDLGMNYMISSGQELATTAADYLEFLVMQPETRAVGCILEMIRDPERFLSVLEVADKRGIPVVALKLGRSERGKVMARAHSGAIAGADAAYQAVFERYNVVPVCTLNELADTLELLSCGRAPTTDAIGVVTDSGGERSMIVDLADDRGIEFAPLTPETTDLLAASLDPGLAPVNPVDVWGTGHEHERITETCFRALIDDPSVGQAIFASNMPSGRALLHTWGRVVENVHRNSTKPVMMIGNLSSAFDRAEATRLRSLGIPVLLGTESGLNAIFGSNRWHRFRRERRSPELPQTPLAAVADWTKRLEGTNEPSLNTADSLTLISDFGVRTASIRIVGSEQQAISAARALGYPVVLKTLAPGIDHKFDHQGVFLGLKSEEELTAAYRDMTTRLGPDCLIQAQVGGGTEIFLGMTLDPQFGPLVTVGLGGVFVEVMKDVVTFLPPVDARAAISYLRRLKGFPLLDGARNRPRADLPALAEAIARFSVLVSALAGLIQELDINPIIATPTGAFAVDALVVPVVD